MRKIFSERHKYELWRKIWIALAEAQHQAGLVTKDEIDDLKKNEKDIAEKICILLEDDKLREKMGKINEKIFLERGDIEVNFKKLAAAYEKTIENYKQTVKNKCF